MDLGRIGIWTFNLDLVPSALAAEHVGELEELGYGAVWVPEAVSREAFTNAALLLRGGTNIVVPPPTRRCRRPTPAASCSASA
jgi:hypothetical protein